MRLAIGLAATLLTGALVGCGGSSGRSQFATPTVTVDWGARSKGVDGPTSALSFHFDLKDSVAGHTYSTWDGNRSTDPAAYSADYSGSATVRAGTYIFVGNFYAGTDQGGAAVGTVSAPVTVLINGSLRRPDGSPFDGIAFAPAIKSVVVNGQAVTVGNSTTLTATAYDANNQAIAVSPGSFTWATLTGSDVLSLTADGTATGIKVGMATVRAKTDGITSNSTSIDVTAPG